MGQIFAGIGNLFGGVMTYSAQESQLADERDAAVQTNALRAAQASQAGAREAGNLRMTGAAMLARQRAAYAASGVDPGVGTPAQVQANTEAQYELGAQTARNNAAIEAWGYKENARMAQKGYWAKKGQAGAALAGSILGGYGQIAEGAMSFTKMVAGGG